MKNKIMLIIVTIVLFGCAGSPPQKLQTNDTRACAQNFTYDGSFMAGRTFKTYDFVPNVSKSVAVERAAKFTVQEGFVISSSDKDMGIISAYQDVSFGNGKKNPLNITIDEHDKGVKVSMSSSISGGVTAPVNAVKDYFCNTIASVAGR